MTMQSVPSTDLPVLTIAHWVESACKISVRELGWANELIVRKSSTQLTPRVEIE